MIRRVDQFHSGTAVGDAVTQQMFHLRDQLHQLGFESDIFAEHIAPELGADISDISTYRGSEDDLLLVHHSIGHTAFDRVIRVPTPIITVFHSITPAKFFDDSTTRYYVRLGCQQLRELAKRSVSGIADSNHNRREMLDAGFIDVDVLPVRTEFAAAHGARNATHDPDEWLFVGRVSPNKHQVELVRALAAYRSGFNERARLTLIGDTSMTDYADYVHATVRRLGLERAVSVRGKVPADELWSAYGAAGVFVCLSEHEGFGVPLLEAMAAGVPVIARRAAAVAETMGGAGVLVDGSNLWPVAATAHLLATDADLRRRLISHQDARLERIERFDVGGLLARVIERVRTGRRPTSVQIQGPFETSYSLAATNRNLALELATRDEFDVTIYATEGPGDYTPAESDRARHPEADALYLAGQAVPFPDVVIRQMWPPRVDDSPGALTLQYFAWEESAIPEAFVDSFNQHLDGMGVTSQFVADVLRTNGVVVPITVVGNGVALPAAAKPPALDELDGLGGFRFLHISSGFPRKGVDVLLAAYFEAFSADDDVSLILKTHPNPHNTVGELLDRVRRRHPNPPDVRWIDGDMPEAQVAGMYSLADVYVHPARGEGYGLPVAEAMLAGVPVISVAATGLADFVNESTASLIGFEHRPAETHIELEGSMWVEPSRNELVKEMRAAYERIDEEGRAQRRDAAQHLISTTHSWAAAADRWQRFIDERRRCRPGIKVAMVTTWNSRCGIADYSRRLADEFSSAVDVDPYSDHGVEVVDELTEESVFRSWRQSIDESPTELYEALERSTADLVHIQYNFGFFSAPELSRLVESEARRRPVVVTLHRTADLERPNDVLSLREAIPGLRRAGAVIVHQQADVRNLAGFGLADNVVHVPIGCERPFNLDAMAMRQRHGLDPRARWIGSFGFLLPHKGVLDLIAAVAILRRGGDDVRLLAANAIHPDPSSAELQRRCVAEIRRLGLDPFVVLRTDFLPAETSRELLAACDVVALPYGSTGESSSAALRSILPLTRPIVVSDIPIFQDAHDVLAHVESPVDPAELAQELKRILDDPAVAAELAQATRGFCVENSWPAVAARTRQVYDRLLGRLD